MTRGSQHPMRRHDKPPHRGSTEAAMPSSFRDLFVKPLKDGYLSIGKGESARCHWTPLRGCAGR